MEYLLKKLLELKTRSETIVYQYNNIFIFREMNNFDLQNGI